MEEPAVVDLVVERGRDFAYLFELQQDDGTPFNPGGFQVKSQIRQTQDAGSPLIADFHAEFMTATDGSGVLTKTEVSVSLSEAETESPRFAAGCYDVLLTSPSGFDTTCIIGAVTFQGRATKK